MKRVRRMLLSFLVAMLLELLIFNFSPLLKVVRGDEPAFFPKQDLKFQNWQDSADGKIISLPDPIIYVDGLSIRVEELTIRASFEKAPKNCVIFYTTEQEEIFHGEKMIIVDGPIKEEEELTIPLEMKICAVRVDFGDEAGLIVKDVSLSMNEIAWKYSFSRVVAMLIVYWGTWGLAILQKSPDYGIAKGDNQKRDEA